MLLLLNFPGRFNNCNPARYRKRLVLKQGRVEGIKQIGGAIYDQVPSDPSLPTNMINVIIWCQLDICYFDFCRIYTVTI